MLKVLYKINPHRIFLLCPMKCNYVYLLYICSILLSLSQCLYFIILFILGLQIPQVKASQGTSVFLHILPFRLSWSYCFQSCLWCLIYFMFSIEILYGIYSWRVWKKITWRRKEAALYSTPGRTDIFLCLNSLLLLLLPVLFGWEIYK